MPTEETAWKLPIRAASRPPISTFPIPHRQLEGKSDRHTLRAITEIVAAQSCGHDHRRLHLARSRLERRGEALFVSNGQMVAPWIEKAGREVAHVHAEEGSLHVVASPHDAQQIIDAGWGELHPLAGQPVIGLPESYVFLYAPTDNEDLRQLRIIIERVIATAFQ